MELREIFKKFNEAYNTVTGRHLIIQNLIKTAMAESGQSNLDQEKFLTEYLQGARSIRRSSPT